MQAIVSVIIPNYNHGQYIAECISSVIAQTYRAIEIIIIDNYSKDNSAQVVNEIINKNSSVTIKFLQFDNKGIIAASRNFGVKNATGNYLAFLDSDDVWDPSKLECQVDKLQNSRYSAIATRFKPIGEEAYCYDHLAHMNKKGDIIVSYADILISNPIVTSSVLMRKEYFLKLGGFDESPDYRFIEDWELWLRLSNKFGYIKILNNKMAGYRVYNAKGRDLSDDTLRALSIIDKQYEARLVGKKVYRLAHSNMYIGYASKCLLAHQQFARLPLLKSFIFAGSWRNKSRAILFLIVSFLPNIIYQRVRDFMKKLSYLKRTSYE